MFNLRILGHSIKLRWTGNRRYLKEGHDGECWYDETRHGRRPRNIWIDRGLTENDELETLIHELMHAAFPWMSEWMVARASKGISDALWKIGYRKEA